MNRQAPTLEDVAREAGVSRTTVSRVINGVPTVGSALREQVRRAVERTGYTPHRAARSGAIRRPGPVALVVSGAVSTSEAAQDAFRARLSDDPFFGRILSGVVRELQPRPARHVLMFAETPTARQEVLTRLRRGDAHGALVVSSHADDPLPALLADAGLPAVLFARPARPVRLSHVDLAHREGGRLAAERLLERGCRRVATVSGPLAVSACQERLAGFRDTMARAGHLHVPVAQGGFTRDSGQAATADLLTRHPDLDGIFAANDLMAQGACEVLRDQGRRVPDDVAVIGFDDSAAALACRPRLTTVRQPVEDMAAEMTRILDELVRGVRTEPAAVVFTPELVVRDSA